MSINFENIQKTTAFPSGTDDRLCRHRQDVGSLRSEIQEFHSMAARLVISNLMVQGRGW
jgi:hypothetical protein